MIHVLLLIAAIAAGPPPPDAGPPPGCKPDEAVWAGRCVDRDSWLPDEARCADGVVLVPEGDGQPRCARCEEIEQQQPLNYCSGVRAKRTDRELNAICQALIVDFPAHATELRDSQRSWIRKRDGVCDAKAKQYEGGTMEPQVHADCIYRRARKRIHELSTLRQRWSQPRSPQAPRSP